MHLPTPYRPEANIVSDRLARLAGALDWHAAVATATPWVQAVRRHPPPFWALESLLHEYPISSAEGLALMRLAEALLRVPDAETAIALTADQLGHADFAASADSALARLSAAAIGLSKKFLPHAEEEKEADAGGPHAAPGLLERLGARTVVAATLRAVQLLGRQFVLGQTIGEAMAEARAQRRHAPPHGAAPALTFSYDMLGEGARTAADAGRYLQSYLDAIDSIAANAAGKRAPVENDGLSIKLSALHPRYEDAQRERVLAELVPVVWRLCQRAAAADLNLTIDAEEAVRLELSLDVFEALAARVAAGCPRWQGFGLALQAYQTRALELVGHVVTLARRHRLRLMCRLVKGAYWDAEIKRAQELGVPHYPVFTHKHHSDVSYLACAEALLAAPDAVYPQFATHHAGTIAAILQMAGERSAARAVPGVGATEPPPGRPKAASVPSGGSEDTPVPSLGAPFELQRLHGMGEGVYRELMKSPGAPPVRVYAPVGRHKDLLAYLVRRLLENGANSSFVNQLGDARVPVAELLASPLHLAPEPALPLPPRLYGPPPARRNSAGVDLAVEPMRAPLLAALAATRVPVVSESDAGSAAGALAVSAACYRKWSKVPVVERADVLRRAADALQAALPRFGALLVAEALKTWDDAVAEVREAVDFLRYYADEAERVMRPVTLPQEWAPTLGTGVSSLPPEGAAAALGRPGGGWGLTGESNELRLAPRGPWVCISPWNFPLAIFTGQVAAALATGNTVLAKPAEQTPGVALEAVRLLHAAGIPADALQLLHGPGETVGAALVAAPGVAGVVFTGSTAVARTIHRALAAKDGPIVPLVAETGGINAMLVDSSALPEQVADAVVQSAFRSAGQRCSALRLLCVHEAIADAVLDMVCGAAAELAVGDPALLATDVGPVIDRAAFDGIARAVEGLRAHGARRLVAAAAPGAAGGTAEEDAGAGAAPRASGSNPAPAPVPPGSSALHFMAPCVFEVPSIERVTHEIFGPVLQVVRWTGDPAAVIERIDALGYGLTLGLQTRIDSRAAALAARARVGNVYVNRNMIGAVVGVQPFGGQGLSGTGPKAGGPHYLPRFCVERTVTINTAAAGGNAALLAGTVAGGG